MPNSKLQAWTEKIRRLLRLDRLAPWQRKVVVCAIGGLLLVGGLVMLIAPGPAFIFIPLGFLILGIEFHWAKRSAQNGIGLFARIGQRIRKRIRPEKAQKIVKPFTKSGNS